MDHFWKEGEMSHITHLMLCQKENTGQQTGHEFFIASTLLTGRYNHFDIRCSVRGSDVV